MGCNGVFKSEISIQKRAKKVGKHTKVNKTSPMRWVGDHWDIRCSKDDNISLFTRTISSILEKIVAIMVGWISLDALT